MSLRHRMMRWATLRMAGMAHPGWGDGGRDGLGDHCQWSPLVSDLYSRSRSEHSLGHDRMEANLSLRTFIGHDEVAVAVHSHTTGVVEPHGGPESVGGARRPAACQGRVYAVYTCIYHIVYDSYTRTCRKSYPSSPWGWGSGWAEPMRMEREEGPSSGGRKEGGGER